MEEKQLRASVSAIVIVGSSVLVGLLAWVGVYIAFLGGGSDSAGSSWLFGFGVTIFLDASELLPARHRARGAKVLMFILEAATLAAMLWLVWAPTDLFGSKRVSVPWALLGLLVGVFVIVLTRKIIGVLSARQSARDDGGSPYLGTAGRPPAHGYFGSRGDQ